jgi:hypothetical protein
MFAQASQVPIGHCALHIRGSKTAVESFVGSIQPESTAMLDHDWQMRDGGLNGSVQHHLL